MLPKYLNPKFLYQKGFLYIAVISMNMVSFSIGTVFAWSSPSIPKLQKLFDLTTGQTAVIASIHLIGAILGTTILALINRLGKRLVTVVLMSHLTLGYFLLAFSTQFHFFVIARILCGISIGCFFQIVPVYVGEISEIRNRGILGCFLSIFNVLGQIFTYSLGPFVTYKNFCLFLTLPTIIFLVLAVFVIPESPYDCISRGDEQTARTILKKLRCEETDGGIEFELDRIVGDLRSLNRGIKFEDILLVKPLRKSLLINIALFSLQQFSGINPITGYMQMIFTWADVDVSPEFSPIYVMLIQLVTSLTIPFYIETAGRKLILFTSQFFVTLALGGLSVYFYLESNNLNLPYLWLPLTSLIVYAIFFNVGLGCIPYVLVKEIFPQNSKRFACTLMVCFNGSLGFVVSWLFPILIEGIGIDKTFTILTGLSGLGIFVIYVLVPETKLKSFQEIQQMLS